jgi:hypothetical protein
MVGVGEVLVSLPSFMKEHALYYVFFFFGKVGKSVQADILGSKKLPLLIENIVSIFFEDR